MKNELIQKITGTVNKMQFKAQKYSPEILVISGIVGVVVSAVMACKATTKAGNILEDTKEKISVIHEVEEKAKNNELENSYTEEDKRKDLAIVYVQTGLNFAKLYAPSVIIGTMSIISILASNNILRKRNVALAAAYATVDKSFKEYRDRVVERFGEKVDKELKYNLKAKKITETVKDEKTGETKKVKKEAYVVNPSDISEYARFFEKYTVDEKGNTIPNPNWENNNEYNLMFIKAQERYANDLLRSRHRLFLNDVYKMLGLPETKAGQIVGWVYDPENGSGDNYVDFGLYTDNLSYSDFVHGFDPAILLDFNVDGNIWDKM